MFLESELKSIEDIKQDFKKNNKLTDIKFNSDYTYSQKGLYNDELFDLQSQLELIKLFSDEIEENNYDLLPINFGVVDLGINELINQFNLLVRERDKLINSGAGSNNPLVLNLQMQMDDYFTNIRSSVESFKNSIRLNIDNITSKEFELENSYLEIPQNEKILRSIERELEIKEALYLLLLQKREEAAINYAVVTPTIKIIDYARSTKFPIYPKKYLLVLVSVVVGIGIPLLFLFFWFYFDDKIHISDDLTYSGFPVLGEVPHSLNKKFDIKEISSHSRNPMVESFRMISANLKFIKNNQKEVKTVLVTSCVKGEGKTLSSVHLSKVLSFNKKVILVGSDLRNPQIHKFLNIDKHKTKGLSDYLYRDDLNWKDLIIKSENLDILMSGTIPPNPADILQSSKLNSLIKELEGLYDYVVFDSAPCILVSDTTEIANIFDLSIIVLRSNYSRKNTLSFVDNNHSKFNNLSFILNDVGTSKAYGYKYLYQYGYKYSYRYNYGYGYGYSEDK